MSDDERAARLAAEAEKLVAALRHAGLYEGIGETIRLVPGDRPIVVLDLLVGDNAFRPMVQDPEQDAFDRSFAPLQVQLEDQETTEIVERLRRNAWEDEK